MPMEMKTEYLKIFAEESQEELQEWEQALLSLERNPADHERIHQIFRCAHTLKGSAGFIGYDALQKYTHGLESALQKVRESQEAVRQEFIDGLFRGLDAVRKMVESFVSGNPIAAPRDSFAEGEAAAPAAPAEGPAPAGGADLPAPSAGDRRYRVDVLVQAPNREAYLRSLLVRKRLETLGTIAGCDPLPEQLRDGQGEFRYQVLLDSAADVQRIGQALNIDQVDARCSPYAGLPAEDVGAVPPAAPVSTPAAPPAGAAAGTAVRPDEVVRVSVEKLDRLLNLVGELVVQNSGFISLAQQLKDSYGRNPLLVELEGKTEALTKISRDLQDGVMKVRMLPVSNVFTRFNRVVRDLARDRHKKILLDIYGEETEIDKKVMDRIGEPLVHLIRNAIDHGIEPEEARRAAGKDPTGRVRLGAYQEGDHICIEVADDGRGLDRAAILAKALERGLFRREEVPGLSEKRILEAVFLPGFSTAKEITDISGRGVGMDVVKRTVEEMGGNVSLRTGSGRGTTVTISLPLTMAIIPAVLVETNGAILAIPLSSVREIVKLAADNLHTIGGQSVLRLRDEVLSLVNLESALELGAAGESACRAGTPAVIVEYEDRRIGLGVDRIMHTSEVVIKSLSRHYREIEGLIGASILGNGRIALIVDVESMIRHFHSGGKGDAPSRVEDIGVLLDSWDTAASAPPEPPASPEAPAPEMPAPTEPEAESPIRPNFEELLRRNRQLFEEIHNNGAIQASIALSQLTGKEVRVSFPESQVVRLGEVAELLGGEEQPVGGIYTGLQGELDGAILLVIPDEQLLRFVEVLYGHPEGSLETISENDLSGLTEMGNILSASFYNAIADATGLSLKPEVPDISMDMCQAVLDSVLARFNQPGEEILVTRALIYYSSSDRMACNLLIFLDPRSLEVFARAFARKIDAEKPDRL